MKRTLLLALAASLFLASCAQRQRSPEMMDGRELPFGDELQATLDRGLNESDGIGLAVAVILPEYNTWVGVGGISHGNNPITQDTLFSAGSITKNFTAVTVLLLAEDGLLSLDDAVSKWLPNYPNIDSSITIRQLLNHTSGLHNFTENQDYWTALFSDPERVATPDGILQNYVLEPYFTKGKDWHYSNTGYLLLRKIIVEATGSGLSEEYRDRLWEPLGLNEMFLAGEETTTEPIAHGWWDLDGDGIYDDLTIQGLNAFYTGLGGGVFTTARDLAEWSQALFAEDRILSQSSQELMLDFHSPTLGEPLVDGYGLGVVRFSPDVFNGLEVWGHGGNAPGYAAGMLYLPEYQATIVIMDNTEYGEAMLTVNSLLSAITTNLGNSQ